LIANGMTTKEIAQRKNISHHTVSTHRKNIFRKLEVTSASELIMSAIKAGWIDNIEYYI
jgi:DNA-binding NarL/FixJ family response regulator